MQKKAHNLSLKENNKLNNKNFTINTMLTNDGNSIPTQASSSSLGSINTTTVINGPNSAYSSNNSSSQSQINVTAPPYSAIIRNNISVTNIKCEYDSIPNGLVTNPNTQNLTTKSSTPIPTTCSSYYNGTTGTTTGGVTTPSGIGSSIRIAVLKVEESDSESECELSNIENLKVSRRSNTNKNNGPRPMSWEGELSENDNELMETDQNHLNHNNNNNNNNNNNHNHPSSMCIIKEEPKALSDYSLNLSHSNSSSGLLITPINASNKKYPQQQNEILNLKYEPGTTNFIDNTSTTLGPAGSGSGSSGVNSPLLNRSKIQSTLLPANPSPDSAIHSVYTHSSPSQSPLTSRHAPYTPSLSRNNSDASHSSCYSYSSEFSPTHSPIQGRHNIYGGNGTSSSAINLNNGHQFIHSILYRPIHENLDNNSQHQQHQQQQQLLYKKQEQAGIAPPQTNSVNLTNSNSNCNSLQTNDTLTENENSIPSPGISRQQLINSPCPICGDKISGFHYGIFSCESCKGFFKRTVQNRKNYVCVRGGPCPVTISTRKKCPACRFDKCLNKGMKLEAIREDRTRGGRSTYQCSYTLPNPLIMSDSTAANLLQANARMNGCVINSEASSDSNSLGGGSSISQRSNSVPQLLQEMMDVEHLWKFNETELVRLNETLTPHGSPLADRNAPSTSTGGISTVPNPIITNPLLANACLSSNGENANPDLIATLCNVADLRLLKIVKWCKSLPLFKNISIDDQICLLINSWCELLLFSCCFRSLSTPGEIRISLGKTLTLAQAKTSGLQACIERMLNLTEHLRRLRVDRYEYVAMKVIVLLQSDTTELQEPVKVRENQEKALQALQAYTLSHYADNRSKFGELLLRIPELQRTCQFVKETLLIKSKDAEDFNLLMELLRGEH